jgi:maltose O-acetyltransferase
MRHLVNRVKRNALKLRQVALACLSDFEAMYDYPPQPSSRRFFLRAYLKARGASFDGPLWTGSHFRVFGSGSLRMGCGVTIGNSSTITAHGPIVIGNNFLCSSHVVMNSGTHDILSRQPRPTRICIGNDVWVGTRATIIGDTNIGNCCVVAAGAVVKGDFPANSLLAGVPAKVVRMLEPPSADFWRFFHIS